MVPCNLTGEASLAEGIDKKLKKEEIIARENDKGICIFKWKDKHDVLLVTTKHGDKIKEVKRRTGSIDKPVAVLECNVDKRSIDLLYQMPSYNTAFQKTIKWYRKITLELLLGTAVVNAYLLYKEIQESSMTISNFREAVFCSLLGGKEDKTETENLEREMLETKKKEKIRIALHKKRESSENKITL